METTEARDMVKATMQKLNIFARMLFEKDGYHVAMVMFLDGDGNVIPPPIPMVDLNGIRADSKSELLEEAKAAGAQTMVTISEAWEYSGSSRSHTTKQLLLHEMNVSDLRPEDRQEILVLTATMRDGFTVMISSPVDRSAGSPSLFEAKWLEASPEDLEQHMGGRLPNIWRD
jgi:hypothetical protein